MSAGPRTTETPAPRTRVASLFTGIGGLDLGLQEAGFGTASFCEIWEPARRVLATQWRGIPAASDVQDVTEIGSEVAGISAGFPCTNLSLAGAREGIEGPASRLVAEALRLARNATVDWLLLENVTTLLGYDGAPMRMITGVLEDAGYNWAYRVVDARFTGLPQRRPRVVLFASRSNAPEDVLLSRDAGPPQDDRFDDRAFGFYWTEGRRGLGWTRDAIPPLKGGSTIGIPSAPGIWLPHAQHGRRIVTPTLRQGEALQGFPDGWTTAAAIDGERSHRWKLLGNAVAVPVARWIGRSIADPLPFEPSSRPRTFNRYRRWPAAAWGGDGQAWKAHVSAWPELTDYTHLADILGSDADPLSYRATRGFLRRLEESRLTPEPAFVADLHLHLAVTRPPELRRPPNTRRNGMVVEHAKTQRVVEKSSWATDEATRHRMQANRGRDTTPEKLLRTELFRRGHRYRLQQRLIPGSRRAVDIVFASARVVVDIRGCYWHACPDHSTLSKSNAQHWQKKLRRNVERDTETGQALRDAGWTVVVVWEHEDPVEAADRVVDALANATKAA